MYPIFSKMLIGILFIHHIMILFKDTIFFENWFISIRELFFLLSHGISHYLYLV